MCVRIQSRSSAKTRQKKERTVALVLFKDAEASRFQRETQRGRFLPTLRDAFRKVFMELDVNSQRWRDNRKHMAGERMQMTASAS